MKRSRLILSFLCTSSIAAFSMAPACAEQQFSGNNSPLTNPFLPSQFTLNKPDGILENIPQQAYLIALNTVLPISDFDGIELVKISGDLLSVISPVTESGAFTNPAIAAEDKSPTAMADFGVPPVHQTERFSRPIIPFGQIASPSALVIRVIKLRLTQDM